MKYTARIDIPSESFCLEDTTVSIEREGIAFGNRSIDYSVFSLLRPINHAVFITLMDGTEVKVSMLGFSFDGFWEEIIQCFGDRTEAALFIEEEKLMDCEGEYDIPGNSILPRSAGRGRIRLYTDAVCILPQDSHAVRIPLCYAESITLEGYLIQITMRTGEVYTVGRMGYDTQPFHERCVKQMEKTKKQRAAHIAELRPEGLFTEKGLFRTAEETSYWLAAYSEKCCAVELFTGESAATYLYKFEDRQLFQFRLEEAMEAVGSHREVIYLPEEEIKEKPLYVMAVHRSEAVRFLRSCSDGRIIHTASHGEKLREYLGAQSADVQLSGGKAAT